jgi:glycosyltransferase involved in cell wall biosynthesis
LDLNLYKPISKKSACHILNIPENNKHKHILFGAMSSTSNERKGFNQLVNTLSLMQEENFRLIVFGSEGYDQKDFGFPTTYLGNLNDDETLVLAYSAADVMVLPSLQDNLPNTAVEAIACGTPVVAFNTGGLPDIVDHKENGYLAEAYNPKDLASGISWVLEDEERLKSLSENARDKALDTYALDKVAQQYIEYYKEI